jgi:hypothetical protein
MRSSFCSGGSTCAPRPHGSALCLWVSAAQSRVFQIRLQLVRAAPAPAPTKAKAHANRHTISGPCRFSREQGRDVLVLARRAIRRLWLARRGPQAGTMAAGAVGFGPSERGARGANPGYKCTRGARLAAPELKGLFFQLGRQREPRAQNKMLRLMYGPP